MWRRQLDDFRGAQDDFAVAKNNEELLDKLNKGLAAAIAEGNRSRMVQACR